MKIVLASDHAGPPLKAEISKLIVEMGHEVTDIGTHTSDSCNYADFGYNAAVAVANGSYDLGIVICGTGIGISLAANKVKGIRCAVCGEVTSARLTREHNDANMLALGARIIGVEQALDIVKTFLTTEFSGGERHRARIDRIAEIENER